MKNKLTFVLSLVVLASMVLSACSGAVTTQVVQQTVVVTELVQVDGTSQVIEVEKVITATPEPEATVAPVEKVMVVCMAQEPTNLFSQAGDDALVKSAVLEALYDYGFDSLTYNYQAVGQTKLPSFDDGDAVKTEVEVKVGDVVYDSATDEAVTLQPTSTVTLNQLEGESLKITFTPGQTETAKTVQVQVSWTLLDGITWEDGTPVTTKDVLFAWSVFGSPDTPRSKYTYDRTADYVAVDDKTWTWTGVPGFTSTTYFVDGIITPLPSHLYGEGGSRPLTAAEMQQDEEVNRDPLSFGPFKLTEWVAGDHITLVKNETYYRASEGLPKLDTIIYRFIPDTNQLIAQLASGECDLGTQDGAFEGSLPLIREFEAQGLMAAQVVAGTTYEHLDFNTQPVDTYTGFAGAVKNADGTPIFANVEIRQAIAYCLDRQAIVDQTTNGAGILMNGYTPSDHPLYAGDDVMTVYEFDAEKGKELLAKNGWTDTDGDGILDNGAGQKFSFSHSTRTNPLRQKVTQVVQAQLKENCGIETKIELREGDFFDPGPSGIAFGRQYDMGEFAWLTGVQPPCNLYQGSQVPGPDNDWGGQNNTGFDNDEFDTACAAALTTLDKTVEAEQHALAQSIFSENIPSIILFSRGKILVTRPGITNVIMDSTANTEMWNVENFDIEPVE